MNINTLFNEAIKIYSALEIAEYLGLHKNTVDRWILLNSVPEQYALDLMRLLQIQVDYSQLTFKEKDQFFTPQSTASYCVSKTKEILSTHGIDIRDYCWIEPAAGSGAFLDLLPDNKIGLDIEPQSDGIVQQDYLLWHPTTTKNIVIGNPPFGLRGHLALQFINHSLDFADFVCFILPQLFDSEGKGSAKKRVKGYNLIYSEKIANNFLYPDNSNVTVNVVFQIWAKHLVVEKESITMQDYLRIVSLSDGGQPSNTRNKNLLNQCDYYLPSTCFGSDCMKLYPDFASLPNQRGYGIILKNLDRNKIHTIIKNIQWDTQAFLSTNGAYNLRTDIIEKAIYSVWKTSQI